MSLNSHALPAPMLTLEPLTPELLTLDVRTDDAFESQVRADAALRIRQARRHRCHDSSSDRTVGSAPMRAARTQRQRKIAVSATLAAFGIGLAWPVTAPPTADAPATNFSRLVRLLPGDLLASLDSPAPR